jgi:hypothetical protein
MVVAHDRAKSAVPTMTTATSAQIRAARADGAIRAAALRTPSRVGPDHGPRHMIAAANTMPVPSAIASGLPGE